MATDDINLGELIRAYVTQEIAGLHVSCPGTIQSYDATTHRCSVLPASFVRVGEDEVALPVLEDVPVAHLVGGGCAVFFPLQPGDPCTVYFADRPLESLRAGVPAVAPTDQRAHSLVDAYVVPAAIVADAAVDSRASATNLVVAGPLSSLVTLRADGSVLVDGSLVNLGGDTGQPVTLDPALRTQLALLVSTINAMMTAIATTNAVALTATPTPATAALLPPAAAALTAATTAVASLASWPAPTTAAQKVKAV